MGSTSVSGSGGNGMIGVGFGIGQTWKSESCERRMYARLLAQFGEMSVALAMLCGDTLVQDAVRATGGICPQDRRSDSTAAKSAGVERPIPTAPVVGPEALQSN